MQKIKKDLIHKAKLKKQYAKLKSREEGAPLQSVYDREHDGASTEAPTEPAPEPTLDPHPDRVKMLEHSSPEPEAHPDHAQHADRRKKPPRSQPFKKESELARKNEQEAEARRKARQEAEKERARKIAERERFRKVMAKARSGGPNGQRKLGRESTVLLEKAKRIMGKT